MARKILLADDSVTAQNMGRKILSDAGYEVIAVNNGSAALKKIAELKPDLVILDVYMPGYSGLEVCQRLKDVQDTARIPVLLTVGKLEPFKPEEAQRVRAEGYIVKPFEASELLSALSKLEDKVVPRAEPSRPGRFARAIASVEAASRGRKSEPPIDRRSESRIGFPHEKTAPEESIPDESSFYNPMNRDLRTVVETKSERASRQAEEKVPPSTNTPEINLDLAALAPEGMPHSVTPEEVFAIAAAAAQIQMAEGAFTKEQDAPAAPGEFQVAPAEISEQEVGPPKTAGAESSNSGSLATEVSIPQSAISDTAGETPSAPSFESPAEDEPVTMAASAESFLSENLASSRWTAIPVALEGDEATLSLEQEMQKVYAAPTLSNSGLDSATVESAASFENPAAAAVESEVATPAVATSNSEAEDIPEAAPDTGTTESGSEPIAPLEPVLQAVSVAVEEANLPHEAAGNEPANVSMPASEAEVASVPACELTGTNQSESPIMEVSHPEVDSPPAVIGQSESYAPNADSEPEQVADESVAVSKVDADSETTATAEGMATESNPDSDTVKSTVAAWASWRQIRDASKDSESVQPQSENQPQPAWSQAEVEAVQNNEVAPGTELQQSASEQIEAQQTEVLSSEPLPDTQFREFKAPAEISAWAVAAGAEQIPQEVSSTNSDKNADEVANIVDSVLADLRPKLMAEIARKMSEKK